jgi:hypothetical protein
VQATASVAALLCCGAGSVVASEQAALHPGRGARVHQESAYPTTRKGHGKMYEDIDWGQPDTCCIDDVPTQNGAHDRGSRSPRARSPRAGLPPGLQWKCVGTVPPTSGTEISNEELEHALRHGRLVFDKGDLVKFGLFRLSFSSFIRVGDRVFSPDDGREEKGHEVVQFPKTMRFPAQRRRSSSLGHAEMKMASRAGMSSCLFELPQQVTGLQDIVSKRVGNTQAPSRHKKKKTVAVRVSDFVAYLIELVPDTHFCRLKARGGNLPQPHLRGPPVKTRGGLPSVPPADAQTWIVERLTCAWCFQVIKQDTIEDMLKFLNSSEEDWSKRRFHEDHHAAVHAKRWARRGSTAGVSECVAQARRQCHVWSRQNGCAMLNLLLLTILQSGTHGAEPPRMPGSSFLYSRSVRLQFAAFRDVFEMTKILTLFFGAALGFKSHCRTTALGTGRTIRITIGTADLLIIRTTTSDFKSMTMSGIVPSRMSANSTLALVLRVTFITELGEGRKRQ